MWPYLLFAFFVIIPAIAFFLARFFSTVIFRLSWALIALGCLIWLTLFLASDTGLPFNPELLFLGGLASLFCGLSAFMGLGIWKVTLGR
jgi:hypothetical protein